MPSRNTLSARNHGYSDIKRQAKDNPKSPSLKNFGVRLGRTVDSQAERERRGKKPSSPRGPREHWMDSVYEQRIRKEFFRPQLNQRD
jgi:hypothetical protein